MEREPQIPLGIEDPKLRREHDKKLPYRPRKEEEPKGDIKLEQLGQLPITEIVENSKLTAELEFDDPELLNDLEENSAEIKELKKKGKYRKVSG